MKIRKIAISILILVSLIIVNIAVTSTFVNKRYYRELTWDMLGRHKTIIDWKKSDVSIVDIYKHPVNTPDIFIVKLNRELLRLNGGRAVRVTISTTQDGMLGPVVLYFNPFTKQCIGGEIRM